MILKLHLNTFFIELFEEIEARNREKRKAPLKDAFV